jgi:hypothetical protein
MRVAAQKVLPKMVTHHDVSGSAAYVFVRCNDAAQHRRNPERFKQPSIDIRCENLYRFGSAGVVHCLDVDSASLRKRACLSLDIDHVLQRIVLLRHDELLWLRVGQRTEKHAVNHAEYCGVRANAERQRQPRYDCEAGILAEHAESEA